MIKTYVVVVILGFLSAAAGLAAESAVISDGSSTNQAISAGSTNISGMAIPADGGAPLKSDTNATSYLVTGLTQLADAKSGDIYSPWRSIGALVFVLGALFGVNLYLRKRGGFGVAGKKDRKIQILDKVGVDSRRFIILVEVEGSRFLVGVGPDGMRSLTTYDTMLTEDLAGEDQKAVYK